MDDFTPALQNVAMVIQHAKRCSVTVMERIGISMKATARRERADEHMAPSSVCTYVTSFQANVPSPHSAESHT